MSAPEPQPDAATRLEDGAARFAEHRECERLRHALRRMKARLARARAQLEQARSNAHHDALTGLPNRRALDELAGQVRDGTFEGQGLVAVLFIDLDGFKPINDRLGHAAGDEVLRIMALRLVRATRRRDAVFRVGGDEFVCVLLDMPDAARAQGIAQELLQLIATPCEVAGERLVLGASIGVAVHRVQGADVTQLAREADGAMYAAKSRRAGLLAR